MKISKFHFRFFYKFQVVVVVFFSTNEITFTFQNIVLQRIIRNVIFRKMTFVHFLGCQDLHPGTIQGINLHINKLCSSKFKIPNNMFPLFIFSIFNLIILEYCQNILKYIIFERI